MQKSAPILWSSFSTAAIVGGVFAFCFGILHPDSVLVDGLWPFNGIWNSPDYCFLGAVMSAVGAGTLTATILRWKTGGVQQTASAIEGNRVTTEDLQKVLKRLQNLKQQVAATQDTSHQFNLSCDTMLTKLEQRVQQLESRQSPWVAGSAAPTEEAQQQQVGRQ